LDLYTLRLVTFSMPDQDTIAAISTPVGMGGIGIIRISGPQAAAIVQPLFPASPPLKNRQSHHLTLENIVDPVRRTVIDQVLLTIMKGPNTYTGKM
jgi:tRNA modification GTPase